MKERNREMHNVKNMEKEKERKIQVYWKEEVPDLYFE